MLSKGIVKNETVSQLAKQRQNVKEAIFRLLFLEIINF
jgi:hypothetical protein